MSEANKAATRKLFEFMSGADLSQVEEVIAPNMVDHEEVPGIDNNGPEGFKRTVGFFRSAFPDLKMEVIDLIAEGDKTVAHFHIKGTNNGPFMGMPATGKPVDITGADIFKFEGGKVVDHWGFYQEAKMMHQLGMMPGQ